MTRLLAAFTQSPDGLLWSNGEFCCAIGLCCPPASASRRTALIAELSHGMKDKSDAGAAAVAHCADWLVANVDMLPKGTVDLAKVKDVLKARKEG